MNIEEQLQSLRNKWKLSTISEREILRVRARALLIAKELQNSGKKSLSL